MPPRKARLGGRLLGFLSAALARKAQARRPRPPPASTPPGRIAANREMSRTDTSVVAVGVPNRKFVGAMYGNGISVRASAGGSRETIGDEDEATKDERDTAMQTSTHRTKDHRHHLLASHCSLVYNMCKTAEFVHTYQYRRLVIRQQEFT